jgi:hypothetical protein
MRRKAESVLAPDPASCTGHDRNSTITQLRHLAHNLVIWHRPCSFGNRLAWTHHDRPDLSLFDKVPDRIRASRRRHHALCWAFTPNPVRFECVAVHSILPPELTQAVDEVLSAAGVLHVAHGDADPVEAASAATADPHCRIVIGPCRSRAVAEAVEVTAPAGLAMIAPIATWVGVTHDDEPGCDDPARHRGTIVRLVARDIVVAQRIADRVRDANQRAIVIAGTHEYGVQLDAQLARCGLPRANGSDEADVIVLAGLRGHEEIDRARALAPMSIIAFDGIQPERFPDQDVVIGAVFASSKNGLGVPEARRAAELAVAALARGGDTIQQLRELGPFDDHGDLLDPVVRFEQHV